MNKNLLKKIILTALLILTLALVMTGCVPGDGAKDAANPAGFFSGVWHGWIAPVSLILSLFNKDLSIYETFNNGLLYNIGYYMAVISPFGGLAVKRKKSK